MPEEMENLSIAVNPFAAADVAGILRERGWSAGTLSAEQVAWGEHAATILGPQSADRETLAALLGLVFHYNLRGILAGVGSPAGISGDAVGGVGGHLARLLLKGV